MTLMAIPDTGCWGERWGFSLQFPDAICGGFMDAGVLMAVPYAGCAGQR